MFFVSFYISKVNLLWTMGNLPAFYIYRYAFCFIFMYIIIGARSFENIENGTKTWNTILAIFIYQIIGICVIKFDLGTFDPLWVKVDMCLALVLGIIIELSKINLKNAKRKMTLFFQKYKTRIIGILLFMIAIINVTRNDAYVMKILRDEAGPKSLEDYDRVRSYYDYRHKKLEEFDNEVYRIDCKINTTLNEGLISGDNTVNHSSSTYSKSLYDFLKKLGYSVEHVIVTNGKGNTRGMDMLFGIKYKTEKPNNQEAEEIEIGDGIKVYKNPYTLNLAFSVPNSILENCNLDEYNALESQNSLLKNVANLDEVIYTKNQGKIEERLENLQINSEGKYERVSKESPRKIDI